MLPSPNHMHWAHRPVMPVYAHACCTNTFMIILFMSVILHMHNMHKGHVKVIQSCKASPALARPIMPPEITVPRLVLMTPAANSSKRGISELYSTRSHL